MKGKFFRVFVKPWDSWSPAYEVLEFPVADEHLVHEDENSIIKSWRRLDGLWQGKRFIPWHSIHSIDILEGEPK